MDSKVKVEEPPPSYEDSQSASLQDILRGAKRIAPKLWPAAAPPAISVSASPPAPWSQLFTRIRDRVAGRERQQQQQQERERERQEQERQEREEAMAVVVQVLEDLARVPCHGRPFVDRVREFSDFYFKPYTVSNSGRHDHESNNASINKSDGSPHGVHIAVPLQEQHSAILASLGVHVVEGSKGVHQDGDEAVLIPNESAALVLCARVLEEYYEGLKHRDSNLVTLGNGMGMDAGGGGRRNDDDENAMKARAEERAEARARARVKAKAAIPSLAISADVERLSRSHQRRVLFKTRLYQIAPCREQDCSCFDYDEKWEERRGVGKEKERDESHDRPEKSGTSRPSSSSSPTSTTPSGPLLCHCGHPRNSHLPNDSSPHRLNLDAPSSSSRALLSVSSSSKHLPPQPPLPNPDPNPNPGLTSLLLRYTNWQNRAYASLEHRDAQGLAKVKLDQISACTNAEISHKPRIIRSSSTKVLEDNSSGPAVTVACPCPDLDKARRSGRCARCGRYCDMHLSTLFTAAPSGTRGKTKWRKEKGGEKEKKTEKGKEEEEETGNDDDNEVNQYRDLSWILIEKAYSLLTPSSTRSGS